MTDRDTLILKNQPLARFIAREMHAKASGVHVDLEDLESEATVALIRAIDAYDAGRGVPLGAWLALQIRRGLLDVFRNEDGRGRRIVSKMIAGERVGERLTHEFGRVPTVGEIDVEIPGYRTAWEVTHRATVTILYGEVLPAPEDTARAALHAVDLERLWACVAGPALTRCQREVIVALYRDGEGLAPLAERLGITVSAVEDRRLCALRRLRAALKGPIAA